MSRPWRGGVNDALAICTKENAREESPIEEASQV